MSSHQRKFYQEDEQSWWLCCHEGAGVFVLVETNSSGDHANFQIADFLVSEQPPSAQQALLKLIGSLASYRDQAEDEEVSRSGASGGHR
jgi:hypothetical protein